MDRDFAEKQDLWSEMNELWVSRQARRRRMRLTCITVASLLLLWGGYVYTAAIPSSQPLYLHVQGHSLATPPVHNDAAAFVEQQEDRIEIAETLSI